MKFERKFILTLETDTNKLSKTNIKATTITAPDKVILWHDRPYVKYEQIRLDENFRQYFEGIIMSNKAFSTGMQKTPYSKNYKINWGTSSYKVEFTEAYRQFDYLEISLVHDNSDAHQTISDSDNLEPASTVIKNVELENASSNYSLSNDLDFDFENDFDKQQLYKQFVPYNWKGYRLAPLI